VGQGGPPLWQGHQPRKDGVPAAAARRHGLVGQAHGRRNGGHEGRPPGREGRAVGAGAGSERVAAIVVVLVEGLLAHRPQPVDVIHIQRPHRALLDDQAGGQAGLVGQAAASGGGGGGGAGGEGGGR
jgi:hypothetical protein